MKKKYKVNLECEIPDSFMCQMAANSLDIDIKEKSKHEFEVNADLETDYNVGLIVGASGSGKTTLAKEVFGEESFQEFLDLSKPVIEQFPKDMNYDERSKLLSSVGLTSVPCWIRPAYTLSNGQRSRAEAALSIALSSEFAVIDEWTSVVDRTVAKVMSHSIQKAARKYNKKVVLIACHYDVADWLQPDWVIDCNTGEYHEHRGLLRQERQEKLQFQVRNVTRKSWKYFSKYHYLSKRLPGGKVYFYGLFDGDNQIGFMCLANYIPTRKGNLPVYHSNRVVIHPDYAGLGLGILFINKVCSHFRSLTGFEVRATFSSIPLYKSRIKDKDNWKLIQTKRVIGKSNSQKLKIKKKYNVGRLKGNRSTFRNNVKTFTFKYIGI